MAKINHRMTKKHGRERRVFMERIETPWRIKFMIIKGRTVIKRRSFYRMLRSIITCILERKERNRTSKLYQSVHPPSLSSCLPAQYPCPISLPLVSPTLMISLCTELYRVSASVTVDLLWLSLTQSWYCKTCLWGGGQYYYKHIGESHWDDHNSKCIHDKGEGTIICWIN